MPAFPPSRPCGLRVIFWRSRWLPTRLTLNCVRLDDLGPVFRCERFRQLALQGLLVWAQLGRRRCATFDGDADRHEEFFLSGRRAHEQHVNGLAGGVCEVVRSIGWDVDARARPDRLRLASDGKFEFAIDRMNDSSKSWRWGTGPLPWGTSASITQ